MPTYILRNEETGDEFEQVCSFDTLTKMLEAEPNLKHLIKSPSMVSAVKGTLAQAGNEWKDLLGNIKKKSGRGNTIKV
jgi:antitoxin component HigA of HigAB toxin-antitoxin module